MEERLQKIIARAGVASRRHAEQMIASGLVTVNGTTVTELGSKADESRDHIKVSGKLIQPPKERIYLLLHKPVEVVSTMSDPEGRSSLSDLLYGIPERVFPVGRLEYHAAGLVFLTNDGDLANQLLRAHRLQQTYHIKVKTLLTFAEIESLGRATGAHIERIKGKESPWYIVRLSEARRDALRDKLFQTGHPVEKIRRVGIANLELGSLASGSHRPLTPVELATFKRAVTAGEHKTEGDAASSSRPREKHSSRPTVPHTASRNSWRAGKHNQRHMSSQSGPRSGQFATPGTFPQRPGRPAEGQSSRASQHSGRNAGHGGQRNNSHSRPSRPTGERPERDNPRDPFFRPGQHGADRTSSNRPPNASYGGDLDSFGNSHDAPRTGPPRNGPPNKRFTSPRTGPRNGPRNVPRTGIHRPETAPPRNGPPNARYTTPRPAPPPGQHKPQGTSPHSGERHSHGAPRHSGPPTSRPFSPGNSPRNGPRNAPRSGQHKSGGTSPLGGQSNSPGAPQRTWQPNPRHTPPAKGPRNASRTEQHRPDDRKNKP